MTPHARRDGPVTWEGVELMVTRAIDAYNERTVNPIEKRVDATEKSFAQLLVDWNRLTRIAVWLLAGILGGVGLLVLDWVIWAIKSHFGYASH